MNRHATAVWVVTLLTAGPAIGFGQVLLNEIMYNPEGSDTYTEYVELFNSGALDVDLSGWLISDSDGSDTLRPAPESSSMLLPAGGYALILESSYGADGAFPYAGRIPSETLLLSVDDSAIGGGGLLNSTSETVSLRLPSGTIFSSRSYLPDAPGGVSEERIDPSGGEADENWQFSSLGGTPGYVNSATPLPHDLAVDTAWISEADNPEQGAGLHLVVGVRNIGTMTSSLGTRVCVELTGLTAQFTDSSELNAYEPGELDFVSWSLPHLPGGIYGLTAWLTPGDDRTANDTLSYELILSHPGGTLRIVEVMPDPPAHTDVEWVEIANRSSYDLMLAGWSLMDASGNRAMLVDSTTVLSPDSVLVLAANSLMFSWPGLNLSSPVVVPSGWPSLNNAGDTLRLMDPSGSTVDVIAYPSSSEGLALQRVLEADVPDVAHWAASPDESGGSPCRVNPPLISPHDLAVDTAWVSEADDPKQGTELSLVVRVRNVGTLTSSLGRRVCVESTGLTQQLADSSELTAYEPGEVDFASWPLPRLPGGIYQLTAWLTPGDDRTANDTLRYALNLPHPGGVLRIVEVMPDPPAHTDVEWVEIANRSSYDLLLAGWSLMDASGNRARLVDSTVVLSPDSVLVLAADSLMFSWPGLDISSAVVVPSGWPTLNNSGDTLRLLDPFGSAVDVIAYPPSSEGLAFQRVLEADVPDVAHWAASPDESGGTPCSVNPSVISPHDDSGVSVTVTPNPFSPDGDGFEDSIDFRLRFPAVQIEVSLRLYDRIGRPLGTLLRDRLLPGATDWRWDGHTGLRSGRLPVGIYIWHLEATDPVSGRRWQQKGTLVSAGG